MPWKVTVDWPDTDGTDAGSVTSCPFPEIAIGTLVVACPEFKVTWQLSGKPDCNVCGQASAVGFSPNNEMVA